MVSRLPMSWADVMLPVRGVGITCATADAVETVNVLAEPLP
jgi:hypothetical protein